MLYFILGTVVGFFVGVAVAVIKSRKKTIEMNAYQNKLLKTIDSDKKSIDRANAIIGELTDQLAEKEKGSASGDYLSKTTKATSRRKPQVPRKTTGSATTSTRKKKKK